MKKILLGICASILMLAASAQEVTIESSSEEMDSTKFSGLVQSYNRIIMAEREELTLIKLDLLGPLLYSLSGIDTSVHNLLRFTFEQKFKPEWSWMSAVELQVDRHKITEARARAGVRYYFNMQKRMLKGKSANNFSANYVSSRVSYRRNPVDNEDQLSLDLLFGIQRRLWRYGFLDFDIGFSNIMKPFEQGNRGVDLTSSLQIGIAF